MMKAIVALLLAVVAPAASLSVASRRNFVKAAVAVAPVVAAQAAFADVDYSGLPYLGGSDKIDVNNANIRVYVKLPGMYPSVAGKITSHGPYKSVADLYNIKGMTQIEKDTIKKYESRLLTLEPSAMYVIDRTNNGLYR
ncbi:photosystem II 12 kDa extrinsic protein-domain-containing protein [Pelagophyceae sp. CCMP2097]|nr:photosystem II 12 kDa extrinsic protein-domain-containing protein [Pelagophyceae sp. CCMP2097]|mmetsp:Transcript_5347/g.16908  ORF Transcript_5347/g.16908 Transcript_5347/m.16908 type:complete len:139 (-) Transcript_5347:70-486(-)